MKTYLLKPMVVVCLCLLTASFTFAADNYKMVKVKAPFPMQPIKVFIYPDKDFLITDYGAKNGGEVNNTKAIAAAIEACHKSGGGRVVVPAGIWLTGPIHFKSNVNLYLEENAILNFTDNPSDYLPAVMTSRDSSAEDGYLESMVQTSSTSFGGIERVIYESFDRCSCY